MEETKSNTEAENISQSPATSPQQARAARPARRDFFKKADENEWFEKVISINRVAKVVKGGRRMSFSAVIVIGDRKGKLGCGFGKAGEVQEAIRKALNNAKKELVDINLKGTTIPHEIIGHSDAAKVLLKPASQGTGVIAGRSVRALCDACGIKDILTKCLKSDNAINVVKATLDGLTKLRLKESVISARSNA